MADPKTWLEIVKTLPKREPSPPTASPNTLALRQPKDYTSRGRPTQRYLNRLVAELPAKRKSKGINRATLRALVRQQAANEERVFTPKVLPPPIWRNVPYAFRRFNPDAVVGGVAINIREVA